ncbi:MAG: hypothetical protein JOZ58_04830 [Acetobacteraceae bacterium]|nr:hypothetical protein [Acetobacteraceae bacterium]
MFGGKAGSIPFGQQLFGLGGREQGVEHITEQPAIFGPDVFFQQPTIDRRKFGAAIGQGMIFTERAGNDLAAGIVGAGLFLLFGHGAAEIAHGLVGALFEFLQVFGIDPDTSRHGDIAPGESSSQGR